MNRIQYIVYLVASLLFASSIPLVTVNAVECEDIAGKERWDGESHGDNSPSESEFYKDMDEMTYCPFTEDIDKMEKEGAIKEDTKHDWDWFEDTTVFMSAAEETQECLEDRYDLPDDDGDKHLAEYEFLDCTY